MTSLAPLDRSGFASLDDLESQQLIEILKTLEADARKFELAAPTFRSPEYPWPADPLHQWSRIWEYPYVWHHLEQLLSTQTPRILDLGCGVTFFPFALASRGAEVVCADIDPLAGRDLDRARQALRPGPGTIQFQLSEGDRLEFPDQSMDAVYCISVLEHVPDPASLVPEIARVLKPGGLFLLTIDVAVEGLRAEIKPDQYKRLKDGLDRSFEFVHPETTIHPQRVIATDNSPFSAKPRSPIKEFFRRLEKTFTKVVLQRDRGTKLCCQGFALRRR